MTTTSSAAMARASASEALNARNVTRVYMETTQGYRDAAASIYNQISHAIGSGYITLGSTQLTEAQLIGLLRLIEED